MLGPAVEERLMQATTRFVLTLALAVMCAGAALAQTDPGAPPPPQVRSVNGIDYVNGGAGEEARTAMAQMQPGFDLKLVFSNASGEYLVADHVSVNGRSGSVLEVDRAGPLLFVKLPPGDYTVAASVEGRTEQRPVKVGSGLRTVNWSFPGR
jgi:hypothetical protein